MDTNIETMTNLAVAIAPEDIEVGMYVAPVCEVRQCAVLRCDADWPGKQTPPGVWVLNIRVNETWPDVYRVLEVGLPFVLAENDSGECKLLSVRTQEFVRLPEAFGRRAMRKVDAGRRERARKRTERRRTREEGVGGGACGAD